MYKLLIVDDEQIEREGMAHFIQWDKYDIKPGYGIRNQALHTKAV